MLAGHLLHERHEQHVVVHGEVCLFKDRCKFKLVGSHLVVAGLHRDGQFECLDFQILHECLHTVGDCAEVVVVHLLILGRVVSHQRASGEHQVWPGGVKPFVYEEILLLPAKVRDDFFHVWVKVAGHGSGGFAYCTQRALQRCFVVQSLPSIRNEYSGNTQCVVNDEHGRCRVPGRVAAGLECGAYAAAGEAGCVGLLLNEQLPAEFFNHAALAVVLDEGVVLLGGALGEGLDPVGKVCGAVLHGPVAHTGCNGVCHLGVKGLALLHGLLHGVVDLA